MSNSDVLLDVYVADESSEVIVVDSDFRLLARGIHGVQLRVPPGIYRGKVRVGNQQSETLFSVDADEPDNHKIVRLPLLEFSSPIPLQQTSTSREFHQAAIYNAAAPGGTTASLGQGAAIVIFLRDPSGVYFELAAEEMASYASNFEGFVLGNLDGSMSYPLESIGTLVVDRGYLIASAAVNPGTYVLSRVSSGRERLCLPVVVPAGWSLQVFVSMVPTDVSSVGRRADFDGAAMVFGRPDAGFYPDRPDLRVLEVARQALVRGHNVIDANVMGALLSGKFENPMMGLLAAHLLLLAKEPDLKLVQDVVTNTGNLIGSDYPDVRALSWKLEQLRGTADTPDAKAFVESVKGPPMLQLSWHYFMEAYRSVANMELLDKGVSKMAGQLVSSSVWVSWLESADYQSAEASAPEESPTMVGAQVATDAAASDPLGHPSTLQAPSPAARRGGGFSPAEAAGEASTSSEKSMGGAPAIGTSGIAGVIRRGASFVQGKLSNWFDVKTDVRRLELPTTGAPKIESKNLDAEALDAVLERAGVTVRHKIQSIEVDAAAHLFKALVERIDWKSVVGQLKSATLLGEERHPLTPLQRQLLLSLKAAREQFDDEGKLPDDVVARRLNISDVPLQTVLNDLNRLSLVAANLEREQLTSPR